MAYHFDAHEFGQLLGDAEHLVARAHHHERGLAALVTRLEHEQSAARSPATNIPLPGRDYRLEAAPETEVTVSTDLLASVRTLSAAAQEQCRFAETLLARLGGNVAHDAADSVSRPRVLVVDDSRDSREVAADVLEAYGFHAMTAGNGLEAVIVAHYAQPAVVVTDLTMPVLNGVDTARLLKASPATGKLSVIAYTATPDRYEGLPDGLFAAVLTKPAKPDAIVACVKRFAR